MPKKHWISNKDLETFQKAMEDTKPLKQKQERITRPHQAIRTPVIIRESDQTDPLSLNETTAQPSVQAEEFIAYKQAGVPHKTLRKLRKGQYTIDAVLDLHGSTVEAALDSVSGFLQECVQNEARVVLIIHGKGRHGQMPILKNKLNSWLRSTDLVLAFCSAAPTHGGRGAVYVLIKRNSEESFIG